MGPISATLLFILDIIWFFVIAAAIVSWLIAFDVINTRNQFVGTIADFLYRLTEPLLAPIRRILPYMGGIDISPLVLLVIIFFLKQLIASYLYQI